MTHTGLADIPAGQRELGDIGRTKMFELIKNGDIATVKIGRRRLIVRRSIDEYIERLQAGDRA